MESIFFRLLKEDDKGAALRRCIAELREGRENDPSAGSGQAPSTGSGQGLTHTVRQETFALLPGSPMSYWVSDRMRAIFHQYPPFETSTRTAKVGLSTGDDDRFVRAWWEVSVDKISVRYPIEDDEGGWGHFAKGGECSPYYADIHLVVNWQNNGAELRESRAVLRNEELYFQVGLTWPLRAARFAPEMLPAGCIFSVRGYAILAAPKELWTLLGTLNTRPFDYIYKMCLARGGFPEFIVGILVQLPYPKPPLDVADHIGALAHQCYLLKRDLDRVNETSHAFTRPALLGLHITDFELQGEDLEHPTQSLEQRFLAWLAVQDAAEVRVIENSYQIDQAVLVLYEISERDWRTIDRELGPHPGSYPHKDNWSNEDDERLRLLYSEERGDLEKIAHALQVHPASVATRRQALGLYRHDDFAEALADFISYCVGCLFSRWDIRIGAGDREPPSLPDPEEGLPLYPPGALESDSSPLQPTGPLAQVIEHSARHGILVDDPGHKQDIVSGVEACLSYLFGEERLPALRAEIEEALGRDLREWLARYFFSFHTKRYSKSRRKAPIYWQLTTPSKGYSLWLYYHALGSDTLYTAVREYVTPKIELEEGRLKEQQGKFDQVKESGPAREARRLEKAVEDQEAFLQELYALRSELRRLADWGYDPDLNDGVIINIAPLHWLVPWKEAEKMWRELEQGKYEWSAMAKKVKR